MGGAGQATRDADDVPLVRPAPSRANRIWRGHAVVLVAIVGLLGAGLVAVAFLRHVATTRPGPRTASGHHRPLDLVVLDEENSSSDGVAADFPEDPCADLPYVRLDEVECSNLAKSAADPAACPEGIVYRASASNSSKLSVHIHSLRNLTAPETAGDYRHYRPAWTSGEFANGIHGDLFGSINLKAGSNVSVVLKAVDADDASRAIDLPVSAITFFDMDTGKDNVHAVEYVRVPSPIESYIVTNETEIRVSDDGQFTTFTATREGGGADNPTDPLRLTVLQKNRAVTITFKNSSEIRFEIGASEGTWNSARMFNFVLRPAMACAYTMLCPNGENMCSPDEAEQLTFDDPKNPIEIVRSGAHRPDKVARLALLLAAAAAPWCL